MSRRLTRLTAAALACALLATPAAASGGHGFDISGDWLMMGVDLGLTVDGDEDFGALIGVEFSYAELEAAGGWIGGVMALSWLTDPELGRFTLGAEAGYGFAGLEGGVSLDGDGNFGGRVRALGTLGVISIYVGAGFGDRTRGEFGLLLKAPIQL